MGERKEQRVNRHTYKLLLLLLKIIPMLLALCCALYTVFYYCGIESSVLSYIGGVSILPLVFLYISSHVFGFCIYHRMFLHYTVLVNLLNAYEYYIGIPISNFSFIAIHIILICLTLFLVLYFRNKIRHASCNKRTASENYE